MSPTPVIGRFAPSPTGDLHFGSLICAVGSFLEAKSVGGKWLLRIEDIDPPREVAGSASRIVRDLQRLGMVPDAPVLFQSSRLGAYRQALDYLLANGLAYPCACSRKDLPATGVYPGTCRAGIGADRLARSIRFRVEHSCIFNDGIQGEVSDSPADCTGDFVIRRADGLFAYQLAVVVDDEFQGITQVVRGADLLDSTSRQICLQKELGFNTPDYLHLPVVLSGDGKKLSKRHRADPVIAQDPVVAITKALQFLGQGPPEDCSLENLWQWALKHWDRQKIPARRSLLPTVIESW